MATDPQPPGKTSLAAPFVRLTPQHCGTSLQLGPLRVKTGLAPVEHKISASSPKPDFCALMSTRPNRRAGARPPIAAPTRELTLSNATGITSLEPLKGKQINITGASDALLATMK
jgi:hypothetical protein